MKNFCLGLECFVIIAIAIIVFWPHVSYSFLFITTGSDWTDKLSAVSTTVAAIGGLILMAITLLYLLETRKMANEMQKQVIEMQKQNRPEVIVKIIQNKEIFHMLNVWIKNTGGSPAYNITVKLDPDLPYSSEYKSLNDLPIFQKINYLEKNEEIEFFFDMAPSYFDPKKNNPKECKVMLQYSDSYQKGKSYRKEYEINIGERLGQLVASQKSIQDLVKEISDIKQGIFMFLTNNKKEILENGRQIKSNTAIRSGKRKLS